MTFVITKDMINTATRYAIAVSGTAFTLLGLQAKGITLDQVKDLINAMGATASTILQLVTAAGTIYVAYKGVASSTPNAQVQAAAAVVQDNSRPEMQQQAVRTLTDTVRDVAAAAKTPAATEAKVALLDAVAAQPEVVDPIHVTDPALEQATVSRQVVVKTAA